VIDPDGGGDVTSHASEAGHRGSQLAVVAASFSMTIKAHIREVRLVVDEPTDLPDGTEIELLPRQRLPRRFDRLVMRFARALSHLFNECWLSPDGSPARRPSTLISSSSASQ